MTNDTTESSQKPKKKKTKLHMKSPSQERSRHTVSIILGACSRVLVREGFYGVTTDKVAKEAGVSIGSLYQFFGNKESVVSAVIQDLLFNDLEKFKAAVPQLLTLPTEQRSQAFIQLYLQIHGENLELRKTIQSVQNYLLDHSIYQDFINQYSDVILKVIPHKDSPSAKKSALYLASSLVGLTNNILQNNQANLDEPDLKGFITRLMTIL